MSPLKKQISELESTIQRDNQVIEHEFEQLKTYINPTIILSIGIGCLFVLGFYFARHKSPKELIKTTHAVTKKIQYAKILKIILSQLKYFI